MPRYNPAAIEPKWQKHWEEHQTFRTPELPSGEKLYVLDMFPYPSGSGLHVGHPEGYTATDIVCRFERMRGKSVLHPMGFDAFGLPAEEHAIATGIHPRTNTEQNIVTFKRQLKSLGFSYDWSRELATTDVAYFRWTQWIFTVLFDTWYDHQQQKGRPIAELPIPIEISEQGKAAVRQYQDEHRLAYQSDALVNWCAALGTVLANEEVIDGKSERGGHPVVRIPLRQWMLRITAYADRLEKDLEPLDWSEGIKKRQRDWIGRSTGPEVDFYVGQVFNLSRSQGQVENLSYESWKQSRSKTGFPKKPADDCLRIYTTRPDTLFGATYMVIAPEHPFVERLATPEQKAAVEAYCEAASRMSDRERQEVGKKKTGVFTGSHAINPVTGKPVPIWIADYVLISYGTGAIMAVPAHDERDFEFAKVFGLPIVPVVDPGSMVIAPMHVLHPSSARPQAAPVDLRDEILAGKECFEGLGIAINSGSYSGLPTDKFKGKITADLNSAGLGREAVNYKLRDWLFSRQRFWGEPFPILHELDDAGQPTGLIRAVDPEDLPVDLPHLDDFKPHGNVAGTLRVPSPVAGGKQDGTRSVPTTNPLAKAPASWLYPIIEGKKYRRETNTMPQWAGSCWYYLRFIDPKNGQAFVDQEKEKEWMPVDLYVGGAEHAVLHLLYSRFWHKVLYDRGHVSTAEPFKKLVNQGMILGEMEYTGYRGESGWVSASDVHDDEDGNAVLKATGEKLSSVHLVPEQILKKGEGFVLKERPEIRIESRAYKMSKSRGNVINPDTIVREHGADSLRLYEMFMGPLEQVKPWSMAGVSGVRGFLDRVWRLIVDDKAERLVLNASVQEVEPSEEASKVLHKTIRQVTLDLTRMEFNTAIARMMEFTNYFTKQSVRPLAVMEQFVLLLSPFAPHIAEELWQLLGNHQTLAYEPWPSYDEALTRDAEIEIPVQILGKLRSKVTVPADSDQETIVTAAKADARIAELLSGKEIVKTIVVPGKLVNFVVK